MDVKTWAEIEGGKVVNIILWDGGGDIFEGKVMVDITELAGVGVGDSASEINGKWEFTKNESHSL
ncbi:hypothetical protein [Pantoea sp. MT58]|uniref:hypothetical protein n=1 Tax=Pantoea sp. MT58 TaxID=2768165 RepID=UPI00165BC24C|nr:hypothetical protein [Pantoea sp. MT58]QNQ59800.1 hypothetical protein IAI47_06030 [Pantoea sp. MT58]